MVDICSGKHSWSNCKAFLACHELKFSINIELHRTDKTMQCCNNTVANAGWEDESLINQIQPTTNLPIKYISHQEENFLPHTIILWICSKIFIFPVNLLKLNNSVTEDGKQSQAKVCTGDQGRKAIHCLRQNFNLLEMGRTKTDWLCVFYRHQSIFRL